MVIADYKFYTEFLYRECFYSLYSHIQHFPALVLPGVRDTGQEQNLPEVLDNTKSNPVNRFELGHDKKLLLVPILMTQ